MHTTRIKTGYGIIHQVVMLSDLSQNAKLVYCLFVSYAGSSGHCFPSLSTISQNLKMGRSTVVSSIKELEGFGLLEKEQRFKKDGSLHSNIYYPLVPAEGSTTTGLPQKEVVLTQDYGSSDTGLGVVSPQDCNNNLSNSNTEQFFNSNELKADPIKTKLEDKKQPPGCAAPPPIIKDAKESNGSGPKMEDPQKDGQPSNKKSNATYAEFIRLYDDWFKMNNDGIPPKYDGAGGKAAKSMIAYLRGVAKLKSGELPITDQEKDEAALAAWSYILQYWKRIDPFYQEKTRLIDINSNFQNILTQIKNGRKKQTVTNGTTAHDVADAFANIDKHFKDRNSQ